LVRRGFAFIPAVLATAALLLHSAGCSNDADERVEALLALAPDLPAEMARQLVASDDSTLYDYARETGRLVFTSQSSYLRDRLDCSSLDAFVSTSRVIYPVMMRIDEVVSVVFLKEPPQHSALFDLPLETGMRMTRLIEKRLALVNDSGIPYDEKIAALESMADQFAQQGLDGQQAVTEALISEVAGRQGDRDRFFDYTHRALSRIRKGRQERLACQLMGTLGNYYKQVGEVDSMRYYWDAAIELSRRASLAGQEARIATFYAAYYEGIGRLALAQDYYSMAIDVVREANAGLMGLRYLVDALEFHADLGAWEIVGRNLPRAKRAANGEGYLKSEFEHLHRVALKVVEARYLMSKGEVEAADSLFSDCNEKTRETYYAEYRTRVLRYWAEGLLQAGQPSRAIPVIDEGVRFTGGGNQPEQHLKFLFMRACAAVDVGDPPTADSVLAEFDEAVDRDVEGLHIEWIKSALLHARIDEQRHDDAAALEHLELAVQRFTDCAAHVDASVHGYLWIGRCDELRTEFHREIAASPKLGYAFELFWRDAFSLLGTERRKDAAFASAAPTNGAVDGHPIIADLQRRADRACGAMKKYGATHLVYAQVGDEVWRWTCTPRGEVSRVVLPSTAEQLEDAIRRAWRVMSQDPLSAEAKSDPALVADLGELAGILLPADVTDAPAADGTPLLFITAEGFTGRLPFEALDIGTGGSYKPLLSAFDVGYVRHLREIPAGIPAGNGLVVANSSSGRPGLDICSPPLSKAIVEANKVAGWYPGSEVLVNDTATKANVISSWQKASFLYLATHLVEDPDVPYLSLVPLAPPGGSSDPETSCLDMADIRGADFTLCNAVVLNQCSSGKAYLGSHNKSPGLSSAFLDAGAGSVIQTLWNIRDDEAGEFMPSIVPELGSSPVDLVRAVSRAKRSRMQGPSGVRHPFAWAPYTIQLGRLQSSRSLTGNTSQ
jgi:tetratricopeptide (TPR) repeat protein